MKLIEEIKKIEGVEITELSHAYRINGVVDIYKSSLTVYEIPQNKYHKPDNPTQMFALAIELVKKHPKREPFKKTAKGRVSYQEFKHNLYKSRK